MGPGTRILAVEHPVRVFECAAEICNVELHAPPHIDARRAFIAELREWADVLQAEVNHRQESMDRMDAQDRKARETG